MFRFLYIRVYFNSFDSRANFWTPISIIWVQLRFSVIVATRPMCQTLILEQAMTDILLNNGEKKGERDRDKWILDENNEID